MISNDEKMRAAIAEQAGEWFVANDEKPLDARDCAALAAWLKTSPVHIEEFLGVAAIARDLEEARTDPEYTLEAILARARAEDDASVRPLWPRVIDAVRPRPSRRWLLVTMAMAACAALSVGLLLRSNVRPFQHPSVRDGVTALHFKTRHGEQLSQRLADGSILHLNTDSAVTVRYAENERLVTVTSGQAGFEVAHEPDRAFRVRAGSAEVLDVGTRFDVRLERDSTVVTVVEGLVAVRLSQMPGPSGMSSSHGQESPSVQLGADQQIRVAVGEWPTTPIAVDAQRSEAWLRREIVFDHEPLERVVAEYNRYSATPIEIATPALRNLEISGSFATDDPESFIAFLRSLRGVRVEVTPKRIRVSRD